MDLLVSIYVNTWTAKLAACKGSTPTVSSFGGMPIHTELTYTAEKITIVSLIPCLNQDNTKNIYTITSVKAKCWYKFKLFDQNSMKGYWPLFLIFFLEELLYTI